LFFFFWSWNRQWAQGKGELKKKKNVEWGFETTTYISDQGATKIDSLSRILLFSELLHYQCHCLQWKMKEKKWAKREKKQKWKE
jgi:hypothetical protein